MKYFGYATALAGLVTLAAASPDHYETHVCHDTATVTVTVTGQAAPAGPAPTSPPVYNGQPPAAGPTSTWVTTTGGMVHSVVYAPPYSTVYAYPTGTTVNKEVNVFVYQENTIINQSVVNINQVVNINNGVTQTSTITVTQTGQPTYTPQPPPPYSGSSSSTTSTTSSTSTTTSGAAATYTVQVGVNHGTNMFSPAFLPNVNPGDKIHFDFRFKNHTLTESSFTNPCKASGSVDTNFANANPNDTPNFAPFDFTVNSKQPRYFYCRQTATPKTHCQQGMVFAINVNDQTFSQFQSAATASNVQIKGRRAF